MIVQCDFKVEIVQFAYLTKIKCDAEMLKQPYSL